MFTVLLMKIPVFLYYPEDKGKKPFLKSWYPCASLDGNISQKMDSLVHCLIAHVGTDEKEASQQTL